MDNKRLPCPSPPPKGQIAPRVGMVARLERINFNRDVAEEGLFAGQHKIIMFLKFQGSATIGEIAKETGTKPSTVSVSVKRMEKAGFVKRRQSKADGRITEILLTPKGQAVPEHIHHKMEAEEKMLTNGLTDDEINILSDLLDKIIENFNAKEGEDDAKKTD